MKYWQTKFVIFNFGVLFALHSFGQDEVRVATVEFPPYTSSQMSNEGVINELVVEAFDSVGTKVQFEYLPWSRALKEGQAGHYDAISYAFFTEQRSQFFLYSDVLLKEEYRAFVRNEFPSANFNSLQEMFAYRVGLTRSYSYNNTIRTLAEAHSDSVSIVNSDIQNFHMLALKRIDVFPLPELVGEFIIHNHFDEKDKAQFKLLEGSLFEKNTHIIFPIANANSQALNTEFNRGLTHIKQNGRFAAIIAKLRIQMITESKNETQLGRR